MTPSAVVTASEATATLIRLLAGQQLTQAIHVAAVLRVPDLLAEGPRGAAELAESAGADADALYRLLRALAAVGLFEERSGREFALTELGGLLRSDVPGSLHAWALLQGRPYFREAWGALEHAIRTGENAFRHVHGTDVWSWRAERPEESALFDGAMRALTAAGHRALLDAYDFSRFGTVVDVGGGNGTLIAAILRAHPGVRGIVFDQPHVVAGAEAVLRAAGVDERAHTEPGDFFASVPAGGDAYLLKMIVHDWEDGEVVSILGSVRRAIAAHGVLLVIERELGPPNSELGPKLGDLNMLVMPGGRERTVEEYAALYEHAGFELVDVARAANGWNVFEGKPV
jgi:hypothetical protein